MDHLTKYNLLLRSFKAISKKDQCEEHIPKNRTMYSLFHHKTNSDGIVTRQITLPLAVQKQHSSPRRKDSLKPKEGNSTRRRVYTSGSNELELEYLISKVDKVISRRGRFHRAHPGWLKLNQAVASSTEKASQCQHTANVSSEVLGIIY